MKHRFPVSRGVDWQLGIAMLVVPGMEAWDREQEQGTVANPTRLATTDSRPATPDPRLAAAPAGQQLVADAAHRLANEPAISAEIRYRIDAFGHELIGTGNYLQYTPPAQTRSVSEGPADKLLRLDSADASRRQAGDRAGSSR